MKRKIIFILVVSIVATHLLTSCGLLLSLAESSKSPSTSYSPTKSPTPTETPIPTPEFASRQNPAQVNEAVIVTGTDWDDAEYEYEIVITKVIRGAESKKIVMDENPYNEIPEGQEAVLAWVKFTLSKYDHPDNDSFLVTDWDFEFFKDGSTELGLVSLVIPDGLHAELYANGVEEGYIYAVVEVDATVYVRYDDNVWFNLG